MNHHGRYVMSGDDSNTIALVMNEGMMFSHAQLTIWSCMRYEWDDDNNLATNVDRTASNCFGDNANNVNSWRERAGRDLSEELFVDLVFRRKSRVRDSSKMLVTRYQLDPYCKGKPLRC
jgi:hypothetical protein